MGTRTACIKRASLALDQVVFDAINYPSTDANISQGVVLEGFRNQISTLVHQNTTHRLMEPDFLIYSADVYRLLILFLITWTAFNVLASLLTRSKGKLSASQVASKALGSIFRCVTAHIGVMNDESPSRMLQLALLFGVALLIAIWGSCFSNQNVHISRPKVYETYKSLRDDPPDLIGAYPSDITRINQGAFQPSSAERYLAQVKSRLVTFPVLRKKFSPGMRVAAVAKSGCSSLKLAARTAKLKEDQYFVYRKSDRDASETFVQPIICKSALEQSGGEKVVKLLTATMEHGLERGLEQYTASLIFRVPKKAVAAPSLRDHILEDKCFSVDKAEFDDAKDVSMASLGSVFCLLAWLIISGCAVLLAENVSVRVMN